MPGLVWEIDKLFCFHYLNSFQLLYTRHFGSPCSATERHDKLHNTRSCARHRIPQRCRVLAHWRRARTPGRSRPGEATFQLQIADNPNAPAIKSSNNYKWKTADLGADNVFPLDRVVIEIKNKTYTWAN